MKSILKLSASAAFMFFAFTGMANDNNNPLTEKEKATVVAPVYKTNSNKMFISIPANGNKKVSLSVYNEAGKLIHEQRFKNETTSTKVLNFEGSEKGEYTVRVWNSNGRYLEAFEVK